MATYSSRDKFHKFAGGNLLNKTRTTLYKENRLHIATLAEIQ